MAIQVRRGNEADFDASKMLPGEWAVSLDTKYVRMCFAPGIVLRMATYESFETDMVKIQAILAECKTIQSAVQRIQSEVNAKASLTIEYSNSAKESADRAYNEAERAKTYANNAAAVTGVQIATQERAGLIKGGDNYVAEDGTLQLITETTETTMPNSYSGRLLVEEIGGKCEQVSTTGTQLFDASTAMSGFLDHSTGVVLANESWVRTEYIPVKPLSDYCVSQSTNAYFQYNIAFYDESKTFISGIIVANGNLTKWTFQTPENTKYMRMAYSTVVGNSAVDRGNIMLNAGTTALPYEPYTGGIPSPNPSYPQEIESVKGKNLLDCRGLATQTINGVTFTPKYDGNGNLQYIELNGTATSDTFITFLRDINIPKGNYILSGSASGYNLRVRSTSGAYYLDNGNGVSFNDDVSLIEMPIASGTSFANVRFYPMIRKASIPDSTYVPYGLLRVKTHGKNLINQPCVNANEAGKHYLKAGTYTVSRNESESGNNWYLGAYDNNGNIITQNVMDVRDWALNSNQEFWYGGRLYNVATFTINVDCYVKIGSLNGNGKTYFMLNEGTTELPYEPYTESSITLSQPIELNGIGDVQDAIEDNKVKRRIGKVRLSGDWAWRKHDAGLGYYTMQSIGQATMTDGTNGIFTHFLTGTLTSDKRAFVGSNTIQVRYDDMADVSALTAWLNENEAYAYFLLAEETTEELPIADQVALNSLKTYDGITYLEFDSEIEPTFKGEYGTSKVGGYTLEGMLAGRNGELMSKSYADRITALEATVVNNI